MELNRKKRRGFLLNKKMITEEPCVAHFDRDGHNIVTTNQND